MVGEADDILVTGEDGVRAVVEAVQAAGRVAIDTEFIWERTYAPRLCLVQLATPSGVFLVDPLAGAPLEPIAGLLEDDGVEIAMHAAMADLLAFGLRYGTRATRVVDTQVLAGFVGLTSSASLERLVDAVLGIKLHHDQGFSDWSHRPLLPVQLHYAGDDVRHLLPLVDALHARLAERGRAGWAEAEIDRRFGPAAQILPEPDQAWRKVQRRGRLNGRQTAVLRHVARWREQEARQRDMPVAWLVKDPTLIEIARRAPETADDLGRIRGMPKGLVQTSASAIMAAVAEGVAAEPEPPEPSQPQAIARRVDAAAGLAGTLLKVRCTDGDIAPELVATRTDLERFLRAIVAGDEAPQDLPLGQGWRHDLVGAELIDLVEGRVHMSLTERPPYLAITRATPAEA